MQVPGREQNEPGESVVLRQCVSGLQCSQVGSHLLIKELYIIKARLFLINEAQHYVT